ncbi:MAG: peptide-methionine (S)-S-oxide reductase MsrA [Flavobacteriales bacterium]|nr:peptide-methionine (S)-S-oxide reductase MsrA [Flavobacteriales bacterium]
MKSLTIILLALGLLASCAFKSSDHVDSIKKDSIVPADLQGLSKAYFASGCFWCVEAVFESVEGVEEAISGYAGGNTKNPTYESIGTGQTGHCEAVEVYYDPERVSYRTLVKVFYGSHDPTTVNGQAPDFGTQYRSAIFYQNEEERKIAEAFKEEIMSSEMYTKPIATEIAMLKKFYPAEEYHQNFERLNPDHPYVRQVSIPRLNKFKKAFPELLKVGH